MEHDTCVVGCEVRENSLITRHNYLMTYFVIILRWSLDGTPPPLGVYSWLSWSVRKVVGEWVLEVGLLFTHTHTLIHTVTGCVCAHLTHTYRIVRSHTKDESQRLAIRLQTYIHAQLHIHRHYACMHSHRGIHILNLYLAHSRTCNTLQATQSHQVTMVCRGTRDIKECTVVGRIWLCWSEDV